MSSFADSYCRLVAKYLRPLTSEDGYSESRLLTCVDRLDSRLPRVLKEFYLAAGNFEEVNGNIVPPHRLKYHHKAVPFCMEEQAVTMWGICIEDLHAEDPIVACLSSETPPRWIASEHRLSQFLFEHFCYQFLNGAVEFSAFATVDAEIVTQVERRWPREALVDSTTKSAVQIFGTDGQMLGLSRQKGGYWHLNVASNCKNGRDEIVASLDVKWLRSA